MMICILLNIIAIRTPASLQGSLSPLHKSRSKFDLTFLVHGLGFHVPAPDSSKLSPSHRDMLFLYLHLTVFSTKNNCSEIHGFLFR